MQSDVLSAYDFTDDSLTVNSFGSGLINHTWKVGHQGSYYILQRINDKVFKQPADIANNIRIIAAFLKQYHPQYKFVAPVSAMDGNEIVYLKEKGYFRLFPFVPDSHSIDVVETSTQAFEAAAQFGRFTKLLSGMDVSQLIITIPSFHDLSLRHLQFLQAIENGNHIRIRESEKLITQLLEWKSIAEDYEKIKKNPGFKLRVTHHDTKISNVLFDKADNGLCVIDLDTVMPGYFISDVGDMMRTYLSPVNEEESDFSKIEIRDEFYEAIVRGYNSEMMEELTTIEKEHFFYAGSFMIYMQALRFLTDHLNDDKYYGAKYPGHNFIRAGNQAMLLQRLFEKKSNLENILNSKK